MGSRRRTPQSSAHKNSGSWPALILAGACFTDGEQAAWEPPVLRLRALESAAAPASVGTLEVHENRDAPTGRRIQLDVLVLHAKSPPFQPDPVFILGGGPGQNAITFQAMYQNSHLREHRDVVLMSQRGTGGSTPLYCELPGSDDNLQGYLDPLFHEESFRRCLERLAKHADLRCYSTPYAMDDLNDLRHALGYEQINLMGGSYGTRAALVYIRRHSATVRTAILNGVAPLSFLNPLYHARSAQEGLEVLFREVEQDPQTYAVWPRLREEFQEVLERLDRSPAPVTVRHPATGAMSAVVLDRAAFAEALRVMLYYVPTNREVPGLLHLAYLGHYQRFAESAIRSNRQLRQQLALGMLLCVTCAEDVARIAPEEVEPITRDTFLGPDRVLQQSAVCEFWPRSPLPDGFGKPVRESVPILILSGTHDPVTPPRFGHELANQLPDALHLVVPGAHGVGGPCLTNITQQFLATGTLQSLNTECVSTIRLPAVTRPPGPY